MTARIWSSWPDPIRIINRITVGFSQAKRKYLNTIGIPFGSLEGLKNANTEAAMDLEVTEGSARIAFNTTASHTKAKAFVTSGSQALFEKEITIGPSAPFSAQVALPGGVAAEDLRVGLRSSAGEELIAYQPAPKKGTPMPKPVKRPGAPKDIGSLEELYLTGLRIEQLYSPAFDPISYYQEALRRDPGDYRANTALGSLYCRQGRFKEAEACLRAAVERVTENYIRSKDGEAMYYLGVALAAQGRSREARDAFYQAIWTKAWQTPGYFALAQLASADGDLVEGISLLERSIESGALNTKVLELKVSLLRLLRREKEAGALQGLLF